MVHIKDKFELLALHRTIMEAKFHAPPSNEEVLSSPILSRIANEVLDDIVETELREGQHSRGELWRQWRNVGARPEVVRIVIECARLSPHWTKMTRQEKEDYIGCSLSPILADPNVVSQIVDDVDRVWVPPADEHLE